MTGQNRLSLYLNSTMAEIVQRLNPARDIVQIKALRLNRKNNRGEYINTTTGLRSRDRRDVINQAVRVTDGTTPPIDRRRLRRGWTLNDALNTAHPSAT